MKNYLQYLLISFLLFLANPIIAFEQDSVKIINYNASNGLPQNSVLDMAFDHEGFLWICSFSGLVRFDGSNIKVFSTNRLGIKNGFFSNLFPMPTSGKTFATNQDGTVYQIVNGAPSFYMPPHKGFFQNLKVQGNYSSGQDLHRFYLPYDTLRLKFGWRVAINVSILPLSENRFLAIGVDNKKILFYENGIKIKDSSLRDAVKYVFNLDGRPMLLDSTGQLFSIERTNLTISTEHLQWDNITNTKEGIENVSLYWDRSNNMVFGSFGNIIYRLLRNENGGGFYFRKEFKADIGIHQLSGVIYEPVSKKYFLGTLDNGLYVISQPPMKTIRVNDILPPDFPVEESILYCIHGVGQNAAITTSGVELKDSSGKLTYSLRSKNPSTRVMLAVSGDTVYSVWQNNLSYTIKTEGYKVAHAVNLFGQFQSSQITLVFPESDSLWIFSSERVVNIKKGKLNISKELKVPGPSDEDRMLKYAYRTRSGAFWLSSRKRFFRLNTKDGVAFDTTQMMEGVVPRHVFAVHDTLVVSTIYNGVFFYIKDRFYKMRTWSNGDILQDVISAYVDGKGFMWLSTNTGLFETPFHEAVASAVFGRPPTFSYRYAEGDGISNPEFNGGGNCNYAVFGNGRLAYPSMGGVVTFIPTKVEALFYKTPVIVESLMEDNLKEIDTGLSNIDLPNNVSVLTFHLLAPCYTDQSNQEISYRLDNGDWETITSGHSPKKEIRLFKLSSGLHQLVIRKRIGFMSDDFMYSKVAFNVRSAFYEKWWFWFLILGGFYFLMVAYSNNKIKSSLAREKKLQEKVSQQTLELTKELETREVLLLVITHDMIAPLRYVSLISDIIVRGKEKDSSKITEALVDIRDTSGNLLSQSQSIVTWIKYTSGKIVVDRALVDLHDVIDPVLKIFVPLAKEKQIQIVSLIPAHTMVETDKNILPIIMNNLISNAVKYCENAVIEISGVQSSARYKITVKDTGRGMTQNTLNEVRRMLSGETPKSEYLAGGRSGMGYLIISELVKIAEMDIVIDSTQGLGTKVELYI
ncbi:MAG: hypothetical protein JST58_19575 [Bacteroidetes bacterium]|nr:hypothetical protein [Bacteroidota bacterium]